MMEEQSAICIEVEAKPTVRLFGSDLTVDGFVYVVTCPECAVAYAIDRNFNGNEIPEIDPFECPACHLHLQPKARE